MSKMYLGAQLYTVRDYMKNEADFAETMRKIAAIGYKYVQVSGIGAVSAQAIAEAAEANGLKVVLTHTNPNNIRDNTEQVIADHDLFGCDGIGVGGTGDHSEAGYLKFCEDMAPAIEKIKKAGKVFLYHNHRVEFQKYNGKYGLELILENSDPDGLKLTLDTYWAVSGGIDVAAFIEKYHDRIYCTHLKDMAVIKNEQVMTEVLTGNINFDPIMAACDKHGIVWHLVEQDIVRIDAFESLKISHDNIKARYNLG